MRAACRAAPLHGGESRADHPRGAGRGNRPGDGRHRLSALGSAVAKESIQSFDFFGILLTVSDLCGIFKQFIGARNRIGIELLYRTASAGIIEQSMGSRNRVGIELSYRNRLAESIS